MTQKYFLSSRCTKPCKRTCCPYWKTCMVCRRTSGCLQAIYANFWRISHSFLASVSNRCRGVHPNSFNKCIWNYMYHHCKSTEIQIRNRSHSSTSSDCKHSFGYLTVRGVGPNYESVNDLTTEVAKIFLRLAQRILC